MGKKIKIGFLTERMLMGFGVDLVIHETAKRLSGMGFDVTVFCLRSDKTYENDAYKIIELDFPSCKNNPIKKEINAIKILKNLNYENIDLWIVETHPFFIAPLFIKKPVLVVDHGISSNMGFPLHKKIFFAYMSFLQNYIYFPKATKIITISGYIQSLTPNFLRGKQKIIFNGTDNYSLDAEKKRIESFKEKYKISKKDFLMLYVGRINHDKQPYKGTKELVEIYQNLRKKHSNIKLIMAGIGDEEDEKWLEREKVIPLICAPKEMMPILYQVADVYVSASKWEGFNLPLIEAGWFKTPAISYNIGPHKEVLKNQAGFLVENKQEFQEKIEILLKDEELRGFMAEKAKKNAEKFTWDKATKKYQTEILKILSEKKGEEASCVEGLVDVIILNFNGKKYLKNLFASLTKQTCKKIRITVLDNGSQDFSAEYIQDNFPKINLIKSKENLFFSRGNNLAVSRTKGEYIFFLNNDTVLKEDTIEKALNLMRKKGEYNVGAIATKMLFLKDKKVIDSVGVVLKSDGSPFNRGIGQIDIGQYDREEEVFGACFGGALVRRTVYEKIVGPLDNSYFGYGEDIDWCLRARIFGYKIYFCPDSVVFHDHSGSSKKQDYEFKYYLIQRNLLRNIIKNFQLKKAIKKSCFKMMGIAHNFFKSKDPKRKIIILKILLNTLYFSPVLLFKRFFVQRRRYVKDKEVLKFQIGEAPYFDPEKYQPIFSLDNLYAMFNRLNRLNDFKDQRIVEIVAEIKDLKGRKKNINRKLLDKLEIYLGKEDTDRIFIRVLSPRLAA